MSKHRQAAGAYHLDLSQEVGGQAVVVPDPDYFESASGVRVTGVSKCAEIDHRGTRWDTTQTQEKIKAIQKGEPKGRLA